MDELKKGDVSVEFLASVATSHDGRLSVIEGNIMQYFTYSHLPESLQKISKPISELAFDIAVNLPDNAEKTAGLRKLLEAKDCFVRANI